MKRALTVFAITLLLCSTPGVVHAQATNSCSPIANGGKTCLTTGDFSINKTVLNPQTNKFVENLSITDPKYAPGYNISFTIVVTNKTNGELKDVTVTDTMPQYVTYVTSDGSYDSSKKTVTFTLGTLAKGATKTYDIQGKIQDAGQLPSSIVCVANQVLAAKGNKQASDHTQFCIAKDGSTAGNPPATEQVQGQNTTKGGVAATPTPRSTQPGTTTKGGKTMGDQPQNKALPGTGPELLPLLALFPAGAAGMWLRRKAA